MRQIVPNLVPWNAGQKIYLSGRIPDNHRPARRTGSAAAAASWPESTIGCGGTREDQRNQETRTGRPRRSRASQADLPPRRTQPLVQGVLRPAHFSGDNQRPDHQRRLWLHLDADQAPGRGETRLHRRGLRPRAPHGPARPVRGLQGREAGGPRRVPAAARPDPRGRADAQDPHGLGGGL